MGPRPFFPKGAGFLSCTEHRGRCTFRRHPAKWPLARCLKPLAFPARVVCHEMLVIAAMKYLGIPSSSVTCGARCRGHRRFKRFTKGARLVLVSRNDDALDNTAKECVGSGGEALLRALRFVRLRR